tara:strand:- start:809 stop:1006 length:198 start_codon:yes stop_codon:yes gene_type:complete
VNFDDELTAIETKQLLDLLFYTQLGARTKTNVIRNIETKLKKRLARLKAEGEAMGVKSLNFRSKD